MGLGGQLDPGDQEARYRVVRYRGSEGQIGLS